MTLELFLALAAALCSAGACAAGLVACRRVGGNPSRRPPAEPPGREEPGPYDEERRMREGIANLLAYQAPGREEER